MLRAIDLSRAGMLRQQQHLDATAHNVSNTNTPGFKAVRAALESGDAPPVTDPAQTTGTETPPLSARIPVGRLFTQGALRETGSPTDMAISGNGFFVLRAPNGMETYTRNGQFSTDANGRLADASGRLVEPPLNVPSGAADLRVSPDGTVSVLLPNSRREAIGELRVARFANPGGLLSGADGTYAPTAASGAAELVRPGEGGAGTVRNGALESANTEITEQMTTLVAAQRAYQLNTSAFRMADDMLRMAGQMGNGG